MKGSRSGATTSGLNLPVADWLLANCCGAGGLPPNWLAANCLFAFSVQFFTFVKLRRVKDEMDRLTEISDAMERKRLGSLMVSVEETRILLTVNGGQDERQDDESDLSDTQNFSLKLKMGWNFKNYFDALHVGAIMCDEKMQPVDLYERKEVIKETDKSVNEGNWWGLHFPQTTTDPSAFLCAWKSVGWLTFTRGKFTFWVFIQRKFEFDTLCRNLSFFSW